MDVGDNGGAGRGGVGPHPLVHALLVTVAMLLLPGTSHAQETCMGDDIWCGVVTVGEVLLGGEVYGDGFVAPSQGGTVGMLSETNFRVGANSYTIDAIYVERSVQVGVAETLRFSLTGTLAPADEAGLVLHAGGRSFAFRDSSVSNPAPSDFTSWSVPVWTGPPRTPSRCG